MDLAPLAQETIDAAHAGNADAQCEVGIWHGRQPGTEHAAQAHAWFVRARALGSARASHNLGVLTLASDPEGAAVHFEQAASAGYVLSMRALGFLLRDAGDIPAAMAWLWKGAQHGDALSKYGVALALQDSSDPSERQSCLDLAREAAESGLAEAQTLLGTIFHEGSLTPRSAPDAIFWWRRAAYNGHAGAQLMYGVAHRSGQVVGPDMVQEAHWVLRACAQGHELAAIYWKKLVHELNDAQYAEALALARRPLAPPEA